MKPETIFRRFIEEGPNGGNLEIVDELAASDVAMDVLGQTLRGRDAVKGLIGQFREAFPDLSVSIEDLVASGDTVAARVRVTGTNDGSFMGAPPTGKRAQWGATHFVKVVGGLIVGDHITVNLLEIQTQLGLLDVPASA